MKRPAIHMLFTGNPGTGKTTVARLFRRRHRDQEGRGRERLTLSGGDRLMIGDAERKGQAMAELIAGMLALALVLSATFSFTSYILSSLEMQGTLRREAGQDALNAFGAGLKTAKDAEVLAVEPLAAEYIFGSQTFKVKERVAIPNMGGLGQ